MKLKSIIFSAIILFSQNIFSQDIENQSFDNDIDSIIVPPDYEKAVENLMSGFFLDRSYFDECNGAHSTPVYYADSVYVNRLQKLPYVIDMPYNSIVRSFIDRYAKSVRQVGYMAGLGESYYFSIFEQALAKYGLPLELKYLPIIESALNTRAVSWAGAGGLWQFMIATGKVYDLEVNSLVDDRFDPVKASDAAARYLRDLYSIYNNWHLVIAAYNCGPGNVARAVRKSGGKTAYWDIYQFLPKETRGYVPIFIAANYIMNYYALHNICPIQPKLSIQIIDTVSVTSRIHFEQIAGVLNIPIDEIRFYNPQYKRDIIPGDIKEYKLVLPLNQVSAFYENFDSISAYRASELTARLSVIEPAGYSTQSVSGNGSLIYYKVRNGDSLSSIAARYRVTVPKLKRWNGLRNNFIKTGQKLKIYK
ncbi:MAG: transglycosylase SLT domain-containing protein [Prevotellaceae bacterium]|nr:transglycosylase SLT domain-containing protein [Prevotellaceae bacterium]